MKLKEKLSQIDYYILIPSLILAIFGIVMVYSASSYLAAALGNSEFFLIRQIIFNILGLLLMFIAYTMNINVLKNTKVLQLALAVTFILLLAVLIFGQEINGAKAWINLGFFNIQPAEIAKLVTVWYLSFYFFKKGHQINTNFISTISQAFIYLFLVNILLLFQPDMGSILIISAIAFILFLSSGLSWKKALKILALSILTIALIFFIIRNYGESLTFIPAYQLDRFRAFFDPFGYSQTAGHQLVNSYLALSRGGLAGVGIGNSVQKSGYLPEPHTDFIMAITAEELGLIAVLLIIFIYFFMIYRIIILAIRSKSTFRSLLSLGIGAYFLVQATINLGGVSGLLPITGVTFPFVSYGGSSLMISFIAIGLVLNISRNEKKERRQYENKRTN